MVQLLSDPGDLRLHCVPLYSSISRSGARSVNSPQMLLSLSGLHTKLCSELVPLNFGVTACLKVIFEYFGEDCDCRLVVIGAVETKNIKAESQIFVPLDPHSGSSSGRHGAGTAKGEVERGV